MIIRHNVPPPLNHPHPHFHPQWWLLFDQKAKNDVKGWMLLRVKRGFHAHVVLWLVSTSWAPHLSMEIHSSIFTSCYRSSGPILFPFSGILLNHLQDYFLDYSQAHEEAPLHMDRTPPGLMSASNLHSRDRDKDGGWERCLPRHCHGWCWTSGGPSWNKTPL